MGLDIYFHKRRAKEDGETERVKELAYFRKVNSLVAFFENKYGYDREDYEFPITKEMCEELCDTCRLALALPENAEDIMPNTEGFFFGNQEYDDSYFEDLLDILDQVEDDVIPEFKDLKKDEYIAFVTSW